MHTVEDVEQAINLCLKKTEKKRGIIVEATALTKILADTSLKLRFVLMAKTCDAVICCRVSPG
jgi:phospholipid-transporting ATPase